MVAAVTSLCRQIMLLRILAFTMMMVAFSEDGPTQARCPPLNTRHHQQLVKTTSFAFTSRPDIDTTFDDSITRLRGQSLFPRVGAWFYSAYLLVCLRGR